MGKILQFPTNEELKIYHNDDFVEGKFNYDIVIKLSKASVQANNLLHSLLFIPDKVKLTKVKVGFINVVYTIHIIDVVAFNTLWEAFLRQIDCPVYFVKMRKVKKDEIKEDN